jgi:acetyltransferase-like isoleucine patch superfamily enzyme
MTANGNLIKQLLIAILVFHIRLVRSLLVSFLCVSTNARVLPFRLYGKAYANIDRKARVTFHYGSITFNKGIRRFEPFIGVIEMSKNSRLEVYGDFTINPGAQIIICENGILSLGSGYINRFVKIKCFNRITIGKDVAISENVTIWDSDVHEIIRPGYNKTAHVNIGDHVWIGTNTIILKGVTIGNNSIIAAGSVVNKSIPENCLAGGNPASVIKKGISWK